MKKNTQKYQATLIAIALIFTTTQVMSGQSLNDKTASELWSGIYFGVDLGAGAGSSKSTYSQVSQSTNLSTGAVTANTLTNSSTSAQLTQQNTNGSMADLFIGYNYHQDNAKFLVGAQFEGTFFSDIATKSAGIANTVSTVKNLSTGVTVSNYAYNNITTRYDLDSMLSVIARAGVLARPDTLIYGLIGPSEGNFVIPDVQESTFFDRSQWKLGMSAGAGFEHKLNKNWSILAEYRYFYFNNINNSSNVSNPSSTSGFNGAIITNTTTTSNVLTSWSNNFSMNIGKIGVAFRC